MQSNKRLIARNVSRNFEGENEFEDITIYLPFKYDGEDIQSYIIQLNIINKDNVGDVITLANPTIYKDRYKYEFPIPLKWTAVPGKITFWLEFLRNDKIVGYTNEVCAMIFDTREITDYIPEQSLSLLDEWTLKMSSLNQDIKEIVGHPPIIGESGNWYNYVEGEYVDSGIAPDLGFKTQIKDDYWIIFGKESG